MQNESHNGTIETPSDLIDSGKFQRAEELLKTRRSLSPLSRIYEAEVHTYFNRLEEAGELLEPLQPHDLPVSEAARLALARGEWHYWRFEYEAAEMQFHIAEWMYRSMDDEYGMAKAMYNLGRLQRREAKFDAAQESLQKALALVEDHQGEKKEYLKALINFNQGVCFHQLGQLDKAADFFTSSMVTLGRLERGMYYGMALSSYGMVLMRKGLYEESLSVLKQAIGVLQGIGSFESLGVAMNNTGLTLIGLQRFEEAERLLQESLELHQRAGHIAGVSSTLETLAKLFLELPDLRKAEKYAKEAIEQADLSHNDLVKAQALISLGRVSLKRNDFLPDDKPLHQALEIAEKLDDKVLQMTALLYLAECESFCRPIVARERLAQVKKMLEEHPYIWLAQEIERIVQRIQGERIRITPDNWLMMNGNLLPNWYAVKESVETFLVKNALRQSGGNLTKAGTIIGISKVHVRDKKMEYEL
jgi:tetratricopeptide (TPR) repeat protein/DNA-binding protein Fis